MTCPTIMAVSIDNRVADAPKFQDVITHHGCLIRTRLGMHDVDHCSGKGLIILQLCGEDTEIEALGREINSLDSVHAKWMKLDL